MYKSNTKNEFDILQTFWKHFFIFWQEKVVRKSERGKTVPRKEKSNFVGSDKIEFKSNAKKSIGKKEQKRDEKCHFEKDKEVEKQKT